MPAVVAAGSVLDESFGNEWRIFAASYDTHMRNEETVMLPELIRHSSVRFLAHHSAPTPPCRPQLLPRP